MKINFLKLTQKVENGLLNKTILFEQKQTAMKMYGLKCWHEQLYLRKADA